MKKPIFLIGAARSGTTLLGDVLGNHGDVAYWIEPKYIWKYSNPKLTNDYRSKNEADDKVANYIRNKFESFTKNNKKTRFLEKTPSNCFRIPFIDTVFPDGRYIHLLRDGRDVTLSAEEKWLGKPDRTAYQRRALKNEIPFVDMPRYIFPFIKLYYNQNFKKKKDTFWGPVVPELIKAKENHSVLQICALQWKFSTEQAINDLSKLDQEKVFTLKYEDFLDNHTYYLKQIFDFCELQPDNAVLKYANNIIVKGNYNKWKKKKEIVDSFELLIKDQLKTLNYKE